MTTINEPFDLRALLATMKSAKEQGIHMAIWDRDIKAVEDAIAVIQAIRSAPRPIERVDASGWTGPDRYNPYNRS